MCLYSERPSCLLYMCFPIVVAPGVLNHHFCFCSCEALIDDVTEARRDCQDRAVSAEVHLEPLLGQLMPDVVLRRSCVFMGL